MWKPQSSSVQGNSGIIIGASMWLAANWQICHGKRPMANSYFSSADTYLFAVTVVTLLLFVLQNHHMLGGGGGGGGGASHSSLYESLACQKQLPWLWCLLRSPQAFSIVPLLYFCFCTTCTNTVVFFCRHGDEVLLNENTGFIARTKPVTTTKDLVVHEAVAIDSVNLIPTAEFLALVAKEK